MSLFQILILTILTLIAIDLGIIGWILNLGLIIPNRKKAKKEKKLIQSEIEEAKIELGTHKIESRINIEKETIKKNDSLDKLRKLRRR